MSLLIIWSKGDNYNVYANIRAQDINEGKCKYEYRIEFTNRSNYCLPLTYK